MTCDHLDIASRDRRGALFRRLRSMAALPGVRNSDGNPQRVR